MLIKKHKFLRKNIIVQIQKFNKKNSLVKLY